MTTLAAGCHLTPHRSKAGVAAFHWAPSASCKRRAERRFGLISPAHAAGRGRPATHHPSTHGGSDAPIRLRQGGGPEPRPRRVLAPTAPPPPPRLLPPRPPPPPPRRLRQVPGRPPPTPAFRLRLRGRHWREQRRRTARGREGVRLRPLHHRRGERGHAGVARCLRPLRRPRRRLRDALRHRRVRRPWRRWWNVRRRPSPHPVIIITYNSFVFTANVWFALCVPAQYT